MSAPLPHDPPWPDVERLFLSLLDLDTGDRTVALDGEPDPDVRAAVASLLAAHDASGGFLAALADAPLSTLIGDDLDRDDLVRPGGPLRARRPRRRVAARPRGRARRDGRRVARRAR